MTAADRVRAAFEALRRVDRPEVWISLRSEREVVQEAEALDRRIAAGIHFRTADGYLYYNAGVDPDARDLSPGVLMVAAYVQRALAAGASRLDFLRGDEPYKYEWGAVDEPIQRLLVRRDNARVAG